MKKRQKDPEVTNTSQTDLVSWVVAGVSWVFLLECRRGYVVCTSPDLRRTGARQYT